MKLAQHETSSEPLAKRSLDVHLPNGHQMTIDVWNNAPTSVLLGVSGKQNKVNFMLSTY